MLNSTAPITQTWSPPGLSIWPTVALTMLLMVLGACSTPRGHQQQQEKPSFQFALWAHGNAKRSDEDWGLRLEELRDVGITDLFLGAGADELGRMVRLAAAKNIRIHGWVWTLNRPNDKVAMKNPSWYAVNRQGKNSLEYRAYVNYYQWLSPFSPGARQHIEEKVKAIAAVEGLASVHLDYVRFCDVILATGLQPKYGLVQDQEMPEYDFGYHPIARAAFKAKFGDDPLFMKNPELSNEWRQMRLNALTDFVNHLSDVVHDAGKKISAAVFPFPEMSRQMVRQDWDKWRLDIFLPMIYHNFYEKNEAWIGFCTRQGVRDLMGRAKLMSGLYLPDLNPNQLGKAIRECRANGAHGVSLFDLGALSKKHMAQIQILSQDFNQ